MKFNRVSITLFTLMIVAALLAACGSTVAPTQSPPITSVATQAPTATSAPTATPTLASTATSVTVAATPPAKPDWFNIEMTDVRSGQTFSMNDFSGKVVLLQTMAEWSINCTNQQAEMKKLESLEGNSKDLVLISLDTSLHEDAASLKEYADTLGFDWYFAISPLEVDRALSNLYDGEYMNPPLAPMLFIDRQGKVYGLPFGQLIKGAVSLQKTLAPYLGIVQAPASFLSY